MTYSISLDQQAKQTPSLKQTQRLIMSPQMQQAIRLLQMSVLELSEALEEELQMNPVIDFIEEEENPSLENADNQDQPPEKELAFDENNLEILKKLDEEFRDLFSEGSSYSSFRTTDEEKLKAFQENSLCAETSLFEFLMLQAKETFSNSEDIAMAEALIGNFDENGFLKTPLQEISLLNNYSCEKLEKLLKQIQCFEPYGIGASNLQESLLIQLRCLSKQNTFAYTIIEKHYDDLINNRIPVIKKSLDCSAEEISNALKKDISRLDLHPGFGHFKHFAQYITPDATVEVNHETLTVRVNDDFLPAVRINRRYLNMLHDETLSAADKEFIRQKLTGAKWLLHNVHQRNETLLKIMELLTQLQKEFFLSPEGKLVPLTMKSIAEQLNLHESTIARAVSNKYIDTPRGILSLRSFFTQALETQQGDDISSNTVKKMLQELVQHENKQHPLSDAALSALLNKKGIHCARRTVAKYRSELNLGNAQQRKKF